jgi:hypothetical protein
LAGQQPGRAVEVRIPVRSRAVLDHSWWRHRPDPGTPGTPPNGESRPASRRFRRWDRPPSWSAWRHCPGSGVGASRQPRPRTATAVLSPPPPRVPSATNVHVGSTHDANVATGASQQHRTWTFVADSRSSPTRGGS